MTLESLSKKEIDVLKILLKILSAATFSLDSPQFLASLKPDSCAFYTLRETAAIMGLAPKTISNQLCKSSLKKFPIKPFRRGGKVLFKKSDVISYINGG